MRLADTRNGWNPVRSHFRTGTSGAAGSEARIGWTNGWNPPLVAVLPRWCGAGFLLRRVPALTDAVRDEARHVPKSQSTFLGKRADA
jgi:hypothetical protein